MKKFLFIIATFILSMTTLFSAVPNTKKAVRQAEKLANDYSKASSTRQLIREALADSALAADAYTWLVAGRIEKEVYRHFYKLLSINRKDPSVDHVAMADALMDAYHYFTKCMDLDTTYNKKGNPKVKYSPEIAEWFSSTAPAMYNAGIAYMNKKLYYPKAYTAFVEYASLPDKSWFKPDMMMSDSIRANAYFYGGVMAYNDREFNRALEAFTNARQLGYTKKEVFLNQISCLSHLAKDHPEQKDSISKLITQIAGDGLSIHGVIPTPIFMQKYVAGMLIEGTPQYAMAAVDTALVHHPDMVMLHTMKAGIYNAMGEYDAADSTYKKAASYPTADANTLKSAAKHLAERGIAKLDAIKGRNKEAKQRSKSVQNEYLIPSLQYAMRADSIIPGDPEIMNTIETVSYRLH